MYNRAMFKIKIKKLFVELNQNGYMIELFPKLQTKTKGKIHG